MPLEPYPSTAVAYPPLTAWALPNSWSLRLPLGQVVVGPVAGAKLVKTSNWPEPVTVALLSREKASSHLWPAVQAGKSKVTSVVTSDSWPDLKMRPHAVA